MYNGTKAWMGMACFQNDLPQHGCYEMKLDRWLLLSHALCFSLLKALAHIVELNNMFGQIQSPGYPDSYPSDSEVTWNITVPEGFRIKLYFMHFNLESSYLCEYDYVKGDDDGIADTAHQQLEEGQDPKAVVWMLSFYENSSPA
ncbi:hypothetical protein J1605_015887 [Eschrichtius robustus]|uniref:CUB domain-containing protein n=1 Tax=Eschrichtius robustus TaxID=9764 RepID=A0AB34G8E3_ESCRO|nr:hypothetical protein J1605_015887 [Eschrichtius robustus]